MSLALAPFQLLKAPKIKLKFPRQLFSPHPMIVFSLVFFTYFLFLSGIIHDIITETPSIGSQRDPVTGAVKPVAFLAGRINGQYIIEGLAGGFLFSLGGLGFILLDRSSRASADKDKLLLLIAGITFIVVAYNVSIVFLKMKVPNYLR